jgi:hypothetical protein
MIVRKIVPYLPTGAKHNNMSDSNTNLSFFVSTTETPSINWKNNVNVCVGLLCYAANSQKPMMEVDGLAWVACVYYSVLNTLQGPVVSKAFSLNGG